MNAWKKAVSLVLLSLLAFALLCACDAKEEAPEDMLGNWYDPIRPRVAMTVTRTEDGDQVNIRWSDSAYQSYEWRFLGHYEDGRLVSDNCQKSLVTYTSETEFTEEILYQNGEAALYFDEDGKLCWYDGKENAGVDCRFQKN